MSNIQLIFLCLFFIVGVVIGVWSGCKEDESFVYMSLCALIGGTIFSLIGVCAGTIITIASDFL